MNEKASEHTTKNNLLSASQVDEMQENQRKQQADELERLFGYVGGVPNLARQLGVTYHNALAWRRRGRISATQATAVERLSGGLFKRSELRPDVTEWKEEV